MDRGAHRGLSRSPYVLALAAAAIIMIFAFANGYAVFFNDSRSYVRGPALAIKSLTGIDLASAWPSRSGQAVAKPPPGSVVIAASRGAGSGPDGENASSSTFNANRSIYYGFLALIGYVSGGFWLTIFVQALSAALPMAILSIRGLRLSPVVFLGAVLVLSLLTTIGPIAALIMPDIFAASMILSVATLYVYGRRLPWPDIAVLLLATAYAALAHASHIAILALMASALLFWTLLTRGDAFRYRAVGALIACVVVGVGGQLAFSAALRLVTHEKPLVIPHLTAHLEDMGPGTAYLKANCPQANLAVCRYVDRLPMYWEDFIGADPQHGVFAVADAPTKRRLSDEQMTFALDVLKYDPVGLTLGLAKDVGKQLTWFSLEDLQVTRAAMTNYFSAFPLTVSAQIGRSWIGRSMEPLIVLSIINDVVTAIAIVVIVYLAFGSPSVPPGTAADTELRAFRTAAAILLLGVVGNAVVCAVIASPYNRFQARVIWLVPLAALLGLAVRRSMRSAQGLVRDS